MRKAIYWIDDNSSAIMNIVDSILPHFFNFDETEIIEIHIRIFGNCIQVPPGLALCSKKDEQELQWDIFKKFEQLCKDNDRFNENDIFNRKKNLICDNIVVMYKQPEGVESNQEIEEYKEICRIWQGNPIIELSGGKKQISDEAKIYAEKLLERMDIAEGACVGLDLALLQGDIEKVKTEKLPILSMQLYHLIKEKHDCFLYSYYIFEEEFIKAWKSVYSNIYGDLEEPIIHRRKDLFIKDISDSLLKELISMVNESYERGDGNYERKVEESN